MKQIIDKTDGWKTITVTVIGIAVAVASMMGYQIPGEVVTQFNDGTVLVLSAVFAAFRVISTGRVGFLK